MSFRNMTLVSVPLWMIASELADPPMSIVYALVATVQSIVAIMEGRKR